MNHGLRDLVELERAFAAAAKGGLQRGAQPLASDVHADAGHLGPRAGTEQLRGGIDNLLNTDPAVVGATPTDSNSSSTLAGYYDTLGRRYYIGLRMDF